MHKFILKYSLSLSVIWALIILGLCSMPGQHIPSFNFLEMLAFDKWVHAGMFFVLCSLIFFYLLQKNSSHNKIYVFFALSILYGCSLEIMQGTLFSNRSADWNDIIANSVGCIFGLMFYRKLFNYLAR
ncbi:MAG: VanZ family protein [Bacteroidia bacterium]|jgi:glycopeptide antibiotics resistance protein|nr:VanZ family protein [Bacteroidia bacterium]